MCDLILFNANVVTMDPASPRAELVGMRGDKIVLVAANEMLGKLREAKSQVIDCEGRTVLPGFIDAHCHLHAYAESLVSLNLSPRKSIHSIQDVQNQIRDACKEMPLGTWIRGKSFDEFGIEEKRFLNRWHLDVAAPMHPVKITHRSGHAHILNSHALKLVDVSAETGDPPDGLIDRDPETGEPTGILYGMGAYLAGKIPPLDDLEINRGFVLLNEKLLSWGLTSIQDTSASNSLRQWRQFQVLKAKNTLQPRLTVMTGFKSFTELQQTSFSTPNSNADPRSGGIKILADEVTGGLHPSQDELNEMVYAIHKAGFQAVIHAVEEPVIEAACNAVGYALNRHRRHNHRHRIEHCSVCPPSLLRRLAGLGVTVVTQPAFIFYEGDRYLKTVPCNQLEHLYAIGSMMHRGVPVAFSSDFPISEPNPFMGICAAVTRMTESGDRVLPQESVRVADAIRMYTLGAAAASFEEEIKGTITPGKVADLVMLSEDPFSVNPDAIKNIRVMMTILGGRVVREELP